MSWQSPHWLWALLAIPLLVVVLARWGRGRQRAAHAFADPRLLNVGAIAGARRLRGLAAALALLAVAAGVVALAGPSIDRSDQERRGSVILAFDRSLSMLKRDIQPTRLAAAVDAAKRFLQAVPEDTAIGLVTFAEGATVVVPPVLDRAVVARALDDLQLREGTTIGDAVVAGLATLQAAGALTPVPASPEEAAGRILVLTDGDNTTGVTPLQAAARARALRVPVYTMLLGDDPLRRRQTLTPAEQMAQLATQTGGVFTQTRDAADLRRVFEDLGASFTTIERVDELSIYVALIMVALLAAAGAVLVLVRPYGGSPRGASA